MFYLTESGVVRDSRGECPTGIILSFNFKLRVLSFSLYSLRMPTYIALEMFLVG